MKKKIDATKPHSRVQSDLLSSENQPVDAWRIFKIMSELVSGFEMLNKYGVAASFFGSARYSLNDDMYKEATDLAYKLSKDDFAIITGGGPGIMEAANKGAFDAGGASVGMNIQLPHGQGLNSVVTESMDFHYFFTRKIMLAFASEVYVYFPGGFGTMDEFFEIITLVQTEKIRRIPIVLYGRDYWQPLISWFEQSLLEKYHTIGKEDMELFHVVDSVDEAYELISGLVGKYCKDHKC